MLIDLMRFFRDARGLVGTNGSGPTLRAFLEQRGYSEYFVERLIVPQISAIWSANPDQLWSFPASFMAEFLDNHGNLQLVGRPRWRSIPGGSHRYVDALTAPFRNRIHLGTPVRAIRRQPDGVELVLTFGVERFEEVVIATHSDQALAMLADPTPAEREILGAFPYQANEAVLHTDRRLLPRRRRAWASWNYHLPPAGRAPGPATVTYHMNRLQSLTADRQFCVTLNRTAAIDPERVLSVREFSHPVFSHRALTAQRRWDEVSGVRRTHYCGAYWGYGFHEDGVQSARRVCERFGERL
jgi:uncharacterized protein